MKSNKRVFFIFVFLLVDVLSGAGIGYTAQLSHGPLSAAVTQNSAKVWVRTNEATSTFYGVQIKYIPDNSSEWLITPPSRTVRDNDYTVAISLSGLLPDTVYRYTVLVDGVEHPFNNPPLPKFKTFPSSDVPSSFKFGILTDLDCSKPAPSMQALADDHPDFILVLGDYDHSNPGEDTPVLDAVRAMHRKVRDVIPDPNVPCLAGPDLQEKVLRRFPVAHVWETTIIAVTIAIKASEGKLIHARPLMSIGRAMTDQTLQKASGINSTMAV